MSLLLFVPNTRYHDRIPILLGIDILDRVQAWYPHYDSLQYLGKLLVGYTKSSAPDKRRKLGNCYFDPKHSIPAGSTKVVVHGMV